MSPKRGALSPVVSSPSATTPSPVQKLSNRYDPPVPIDPDEVANMPMEEDEFDVPEEPSRTRRRRRQSDEAVVVVTMSTEKAKAEARRVEFEKYKVDQEVTVAREKLAFKVRLMESEVAIKMKQMELDAKKLDMEARNLKSSCRTRFWRAQRWSLKCNGRKPILRNKEMYIEKEEIRSSHSSAAILQIFFKGWWQIIETSCTLVRSRSASKAVGKKEGCEDQSKYWTLPRFHIGTIVEQPPVGDIH